VNTLQQLVACCCLAVSLTGCFRAPTSVVDADSPSGDPHSHDHDEFHQYDHDVPEHKPHTFAEGIASMRKHHEQLIAAENEGGEQARQALGILIDLARWLPELDADSDMREEPWNRVNAASGTLRAAYLAAQADESSSHLKGLSDLVGTLEELAPLGATDGMPLAGDHDVQDATPAEEEG